jgi:O-antigen ligase
MSFSLSTENSKKSIIDMIPLAAILCLITGFLFNRVTSNIGFGLAGIYTLIKIKEISYLFRNKWMWTFMALALVPLISDILTEGAYFFAERGIMKCVLILFPAFVFAVSPDIKKTEILHTIVIVAMLISSIYSMTLFLTDQSDVLASYKVSKVMKVLSYGDHIRISWMVVISILMAIYELVKKPKKILVILLVLYVILQTVFLHFLGSKTGLLSLYLMYMILTYFLLPQGKKWVFIVVLVLLAGVAFTSVKYIPSLKERVNFIRYDFEHYSKGEYRDGLSDAVRFYSLMAGKDIINAHPYLGVGFSRLQEKTNVWYDKNRPEIKNESRFLPSSQYVIYWASGGILAFMVILAHTLMPFFIRCLRSDIWFMAFFIPAIGSFTYETHLEGQLPLFVYGFFAAWFWFLACGKNNVLKS